MFLKGKLNSIDCSLANIYGPNKNQDRYLIKKTAEFLEFKDDLAIMAGDFNLFLEPEKDKSSHARGMCTAWKNRVRQTASVSTGGCLEGAAS